MALYSTFKLRDVKMSSASSPILHTSVFTWSVSNLIDSPGARLNSSNRRINFCHSSKSPLAMAALFGTTGWPKLPLFRFSHHVLLQYSYYNMSNVDCALRRHVVLKFYSLPLSRVSPSLGIWFPITLIGSCHKAGFEPRTTRSPRSPTR